MEISLWNNLWITSQLSLLPKFCGPEFQQINQEELRDMQYISLIILERMGLKTAESGSFYY